MEVQGGHIRDTTFEHGCEGGLRYGDVWGRAFPAEGEFPAEPVKRYRGWIESRVMKEWPGS